MEIFSVLCVMLLVSQMETSPLSQTEKSLLNQAEKLLMDQTKTTLLDQTEKSLLNQKKSSLLDQTEKSFLNQPEKLLLDQKEKSLLKQTRNQEQLTDFSAKAALPRVKRQVIISNGCAIGEVRVGRFCMTCEEYERRMDQDCPDKEEENEIYDYD